MASYRSKIAISSWITGRVFVIFTFTIYMPCSKFSNHLGSEANFFRSDTTVVNAEFSKRIFCSEYSSFRRSPTQINSSCRQSKVCLSCRIFVEFNLFLSQPLRRSIPILTLLWRKYENLIDQTILPKLFNFNFIDEEMLHKMDCISFYCSVQGRHGSGHFLGKDDSCDTTWPST